MLGSLNAEYNAVKESRANALRRESVGEGDDRGVGYCSLLGDVGADGEDEEKPIVGIRNSLFGGPLPTRKLLGGKACVEEFL